MNRYTYRVQGATFYIFLDNFVVFEQTTVPGTNQPFDSAEHAEQVAQEIVADLNATA